MPSQLGRSQLGKSQLRSPIGQGRLVEDLAEKPTRRSHRSTSSKRATIANGLSILIVDDEPSITEYLELLLGQQGHRVRSVGDGRRAVDAIASEPTNVVLLDLMMPEQHGLTTLEQIRAVDPQIAVIIMTGYAETSSAVSAMRLRADDYLAKPFRPDDLLAAIERVVIARGIPRNTEEWMLRRLGERIRWLRQSQSLSQHDLSLRVNLSPGQISQIERALSTPSLEALFRLAQTFGVSMSELFHGV